MLHPFRLRIASALLTVVVAAGTVYASPSGKKTEEDLAAEAVRKATTRYNEATGKMQRADSLLAAGDRKRALKDYEAAIKRFKEAVDLNPEFPEAWVLARAEGRKVPVEKSAAW